MSRPTEVLVKVEDLEALREWMVPRFALGPHSQRLFDAIPAPEWEPNDEQIEAFSRAFGYNPIHNRGSVVSHLRKMHKHGLVLP